MPNFNRKISTWLITLLFCLSQTLLAGEVSTQFESSHQPVQSAEGSPPQETLSSENLPNPNASLEDNPLAPSLHEQGHLDGVPISGSISLAVQLLPTTWR
jgi:hypothetical protein